MRKRMLAALFSLILLCGCTETGKEPYNKDAAISLSMQDTEMEDEKEIPNVTVTEYSLPEEVAALEKLDLRDMELYADREQSMHNSNQLNFGYMVSDEEGNIYFSDFTQNAIFMCGPEGEGKELLYEGIGTYLYISRGFLYFGGIEPEKKYVDSIIRIDINTKEVEVLYKKPCGEIMIMQDTLYFSNSGLASLKPNESDSELISLTEMKYAFLNSDGRYLFYNMITSEPRFLFERGYLLAWDTETETNYFVESGMVFPLLAGNWLSFVDLRTNTRHVFNTETGEDVDLEYSIQRAVSDGYKLYWASFQGQKNFQVFQWAGKEIDEVCMVEVEAEKYGDVLLYLTENYVYWMCETKYMEEAEWGYYRLADGKAGRLN